MIPFIILTILTTRRSLAAASDIFPNQSLSATNPSVTWTSPNNTFTFTFISLNTNPNSYSAAITYQNNILIWRTPPADTSATLTFQPDGNLVLVNGSSNNIVWESRTCGTSASLDDTGNFVIKNGTRNVWSTFDNPTDTLVPGQNFSASNVLRNGLYSFRLIGSGNMTLFWNDSIMYWTLGLNASLSTNLSNPSLRLQSIGILALSDLVLPTSVIMAYSSDYAEGPDIFRFAKLDDDGNLRIYSSSGDGGCGSGGSENVRWAAVSDQCQVFGYCGNLGICSYNGSDPVCGCPSRNFDLVDPADGRKGCNRKVEIENCPGSATMLELDNARFFTYAPELSSQLYTLGISACRSNCLVSASCIVSTSLSDGTGVCYLKVPSFVSGYQSPALPSTSYLKVCGPVEPNPSAASSDKGRQLEFWKNIKSCMNRIEHGTEGLHTLSMNDQVNN